MPDEMRRELARQVERLLEEAEKPMTIEEMVPHLDPILPGPNDVADVLEDIRRRRGDLEREGSYWRRPTPVPVASLFPAASRPMAETVVDLLRELDEDEQGASYARVVAMAQRKGVPPDRVLDVVTRLKHAGEAYSVGGDRLRLSKR